MGVSILISILITFLVVVLVLYLIDRLKLDRKTKHIVRVIVIVIGVLYILQHLVTF